MTKFIRTRVNMMWLPGAIAIRALVVLTVALTIACFGLNHGGSAYAHGEPEPEPAKPADTKPAPPPLPPRPTEYPRGLTEKPKPGQAVVPDPKAPAQVPAVGQQPPAAEQHPAADPKIQAMPAPATGSKPEDGAKPDEAKIPEPGVATPTAVHWVPPKRYHFVMDAYTGLAVGGNDPVAFFVDGKQREGSRDHELDWGGTTWHFINDGNLSAFKQNPEVYSPRFGGRCPFGLSQGLLVEGQPRFFLVYRDRLYLFANAGYRAAFLTNPDAIIAEAEREWPVLTQGEP